MERIALLLKKISDNFKVMCLIMYRPVFELQLAVNEYNTIKISGSMKTVNNPYATM